MYASTWKRFWAFLIDVAIFIILFVLLNQILSGYTVPVVLVVLIWLYYALLESSPWQASLGKIIVGIKVVDKKGKRLSFWKATKRLATRLLTNISFYLSFFTKNQETLHDKMSKSVVIRKNTEFNPDLYAEPEEASLTLITVSSVLIALVFVVLVLIFVVLPQYQKIGDRVLAYNIVEYLNAAAKNRPQRIAASKDGEEHWLQSYVGCLSSAKDPKTLECRGFTLTLTPEGIRAETRLANWDKYYLFKNYENGLVYCHSNVKAGVKFCHTLDLN